MKILVDENLPKRLKRELSMFEVATVREMGWQGLKNGDLIRAMLEKGFEVLLTFDRNMEFQQNFSKHPVSILLLSAKDNQLATLRPLVPKLIEQLRGRLAPGVVEIRGQ